MFIPIISGKNRKGFSLIEVVVSMAIFIILSFSIYNLKLSYIHLKEESNNYKISLDLFKTIEYICRHEYTYESLYSKKNNKYYINSHNVDLHKLFTLQLNTLESEKGNEYPYIGFEIRGDNYLEIECSFYFNKDKSIKYDFIRGKFDEKGSNTY